MKINNELLNQIKHYVDVEKIDDENEILTLLKSKEETPELKYLIARLFYDFGMETNELKYIDESINLFEEIEEGDFDSINYYLGTLYLAKYYSLENKPKFLIDSEKLLYMSKFYLNQEIFKRDSRTFREANVNLGIVYNIIGRTIDALDCFEKVLENHNSVYAYYNKGYALYTYSSFTNNPSLVIREAYNCFKSVVECDDFPVEMKQKSEQYIGEISSFFDEDFLEGNLDEEYEILYETDFEGFMIKYCLDNQLYLNLCNFCQSCPNSVGDTIVIEKMIWEVVEDGEDNSLLILSSYLNQLKMDYVSARFLLMLSQYDDFDLEIITKYVCIVDTQFSKENDIQVQFLKDAFKNFFNILDKIAYFMNDYLHLGVKPDKVNFRSVWFKYKFDEEKRRNIKVHNKKLLEMNNLGLTALYDIYLELDYGNEKEYLRKTRNSLTHKYLRITEEQSENSKTILNLHNETIEIAILAKNAIIYLMRLVKINEEQKEMELDIECDEVLK